MGVERVVEKQKQFKYIGVIFIKNGGNCLEDCLMVNKKCRFNK